MEDSNIIQVPVTIVNRCEDITIQELYLSGVGLEDWGEDVLGDEVLPCDCEITLTFNIDSDNLEWDIKAVDEEGTSVEFRELDLSDLDTSGGTITLTIEDGVPYATAE